MLWRVEGDFTAGKLTPTDFDFLHAGLAFVQHVKSYVCHS